MGKGANSSVSVASEPGGVRRRGVKSVSAAEAEPEKMEVMIDGRFYDVTSMIRKHPGGRIIRYYKGTDATEAFHEFHHRSTRAYKWLRTLKSRSVAAEDKAVPHAAGGDALLKDYAALREQFKAEGMFDPVPLHVAYRITELVAMHALGLYVALGLGYLIPGLIILGIAQGRCGWFMHEGGHHSATGVIPVDIALQVFFYGFGCGMSAAFWRNQHNKHHATPQKLRHDVDLDTLPLVAFNSRVAHIRPKMVNRAWIRLQPYLFAPLTTLVVALGWQFFLHPRHSFRTGRFSELAAMAARYAAWAYTFGHLGVGAAVASYVFYTWVGGAYIFVTFAVSHTHKPVVGENEHKDWVRYAAEHTTNINDSWWCNWWMGFLNFQIEHHLFPAMPQVNHPRIAPRVKALFKRHGLEYDQRSLGSALVATFANLRNVGDDVWFG